MSSPVSLPPREVAQVLGLLRWLLITIFVVLGYVVLSYLAGVLGPILAALGIAYLLNPVLERLVRQGMSRALGAGLLIATFITVVAAAITMFAPVAVRQLHEFVVSLPQFVDNLGAWTKQNLGIELPSDWKAYVTSDSMSAKLSQASGPLSRIAGAAVGGVFSALAVGAELLLIPVFSFYFLADWPNLLRRIDHMIPPRRRADIRELAREIDRVVAGWVRGQANVTMILAVLYAIGFTVVGMPLSLPIGLAVGALTVIPFIGTFVGASLAVLVTLAAGGSAETVALVGAVIGVLHLLEAAVLTPKIVGHRVGLSESGALLAVVAGGKLLGFVGVVLAVPIAATTAVLMRYVVRYYEHTAFFGHESDADVVITPAMALIMPGVVLGAKVVDAGAAAELSPARDAAAEGDAGGDKGGDKAAQPASRPATDEWMFEPELPLGPSGAPRAITQEDKP
jgi:predicted PurR-regulated permease PerM